MLKMSTNSRYTRDGANRLRRSMGLTELRADEPFNPDFPLLGSDRADRRAGVGTQSAAPSNLAAIIADAIIENSGADIEMYAVNPHAARSAKNAE